MGGAIFEDCEEEEVGSGNGRDAESQIIARHHQQGGKVLGKALTCRESA